MTAVGWLGYNTTCQFSVAYTASQKLLEIVLKSGIHFSHVNSHNCAKLDEIWLLRAPGKVGDWERRAFFFSLPGGDIISSSSPYDEQCPQTSQVIWLYIYKTLWQKDWSCAVKRWRKYRWHRGVFFFFSFSFQQICARCVNIDNFSRAQLKAQYRFLFDEGKREWGSILAMVFTGNVLPLLPNLSRQNQKSCFPNEPLSHPLFWTQFLSPH